MHRSLEKQNERCSDTNLDTKFVYTHGVRASIRRRRWAADDAAL